MKSMKWNRLAWIVAALALAVMVFAPSLAESSRLTAQVDESFEIDGVVYPAGRLTVKAVRDYTPSSVLSEIWVGGECLGLFRATKVAPGAAGGSDALTFERSATGRLVLVGYSAGNRPDPSAYRFEAPGSPTGSDAAQLARR